MRTKTEPLIHQKVTDWLYNILQFIAGVPNEWLSEAELELIDRKSKKPTVEMLAHHMRVTK